MKGDNNHADKVNAQNVDCSLPHSTEHASVTTAAPIQTFLEYFE
jgi:hypothetical protein